jgi:endonuclease VIII
VPEGDTVHLAARRLNNALQGQVLVRSDFRVPRWATTDLSGRRVLEVVARGKHLLFRIEGSLTLHTHFKMEGAWHLYKPAAKWRGPQHQVRLVLATKEWVAVGWRLGRVDILPTSSEAELLEHLGPDPLGSDWDPEVALQRMLGDPKRAIEEALLDQRVMAGPGNVYKSEVCWLRGIHPRTPVAEVNDLPGMIALVKRLMEANRDTGMQITTGDTRRGRGRWVYGRGGEPCRRCGVLIERSEEVTGRDRVTYWCPQCQPEPAVPVRQSVIYSGRDKLTDRLG